MLYSLCVVILNLCIFKFCLKKTIQKTETWTCLFTITMHPASAHRTFLPQLIITGFLPGLKKSDIQKSQFKALIYPQFVEINQSNILKNSMNCLEARFQSFISLLVQFLVFFSLLYVFKLFFLISQQIYRCIFFRIVRTVSKSTKMFLLKALFRPFI